VLCSWLLRVTGKKSPPRGGRAEHRATDLRWQTRRKRPSQSLGRLHLSSCYFSQAFEDRHFKKREMGFGKLWRSGAVAYVPALLADDCRLIQRNRLIFARSTISSPRPLITALSVKRVNPFICARLIVGGMESSCRWTKTSTKAGPSCFRA